MASHKGFTTVHSGGAVKVVGAFAETVSAAKAEHTLRSSRRALEVLAMRRAFKNNA